MKLTKEITGQLIIKTENPVIYIKEKYGLFLKEFCQKHAPKDLKCVWNKNNSKIDLISWLILNKR